MLREYDLLGPLEGESGLIIGLDKGVDLIAHLAWRGEARAGQGFGGENGEPYLHLIEPGGMGRRKMEMDVLVPRQPNAGTSPGGGPWDHYECWQRVLGVN